MKFDELSSEQADLARSCKSPEERLSFIKESGIELTDEQLEAISGGLPPSAPEVVCQGQYPYHDDVETGRTRPGRYFGDIWPDVEYRCRRCGKITWGPY